MMPDNIVYGRVTQADVNELVDSLAKGEVLERLVLPASDYEMSTAAPGLPEEPAPPKP